MRLPFALLLTLGCDPSTDCADAKGEGCADDSAAVDVWSLDLDPSCNPLAMGDDCLTPYPSLVFTEEDATTPTGLRLSYSADNFWSPDGALPIDPAMFNVYDGAPPIGQAIVNLGADVHPDFLWGHGEAAASVADGAAIVMLNVDTGERVPLLTEMDQNQRDLAYDGRWALILRPVAPLDFGGHYVVALTDALTDADGAAFTSPDAFVALRDGRVTDSEVVEGMRDRYEGLFSALEAAGTPREGLLLAWDFVVASQDAVLGPILSMREQTLALAASDGFAYTITSVETDPNANTHLLVKGTFTPPDFLDEDNTLVLESNAAQLQAGDDSYPFTMIVPPSALGGEPAPLVVFGHGIFGSGDTYLDGWVGENYIQPLANTNGAVVVATDWIGLSEGDIDLIIAEVVPDLSRIQLVTDRLAQSLVNNLALTELALADLQYDEALGLDGAELLSGEVYYYGVSLGGVQGSSFTSLSPRVTRAVVAVPGASWSNMIQRSTQFESIETLVDALYPDPLSQLMFVSLFQTYFDRSDPVNLGRLMQDDPVYGKIERTVVLQEAIGDCQVPNMATEILARTLGASVLEIAYEDVWGLDTVASPAGSGVYLTQIAVPDLLDAYTPPDQNTLPETDNGTHGEATITDAAFEQMLTVLATGEAVHTCDGVCDPE